MEKNGEKKRRRECRKKESELFKSCYQWIPWKLRQLSLPYYHQQTNNRKDNQSNFPRIVLETIYEDKSLKKQQSFSSFSKTTSYSSSSSSSSSLSFSSSSYSDFSSPFSFTTLTTKNQTHQKKDFNNPYPNQLEGFHGYNKHIDNQFFYYKIKERNEEKEGVKKEKKKKGSGEGKKEFEKQEEKVFLSYQAIIYKLYLSSAILLTCFLFIVILICFACNKKIILNKTRQQNRININKQKKSFFIKNKQKNEKKAEGEKEKVNKKEEKKEEEEDEKEWKNFENSKGCVCFGGEKGFGFEGHVSSGEENFIEFNKKENKIKQDEIVIEMTPSSSTARLWVEEAPLSGQSDNSNNKEGTNEEKENEEEQKNPRKISTFFEKINKIFRVRKLKNSCHGDKEGDYYTEFNYYW